MGRLNNREINSLLSEPIVSFITTLNADGSPHTSPVWHSLENEKLIVATQPQTIKVKNIYNDPRVSLVAAADRIPQPWVQFNGKAIDVANNGDLIVKLADGSIREFSSGEVTLQQ